MRQPNLKQLEKRVEEWNRTVPVGTEIAYHPVIGAPAHRMRKTKTIAQILGGHTAVVWLEESGCVALDACVPPKPVSEYPD